MSKNTFMLLALTAILPPAFSICESECETIVLLLSSCSLPPITRDWEIVRDATEERNVTGLANTSWSRGPTTHTIATYAEAECFCLGARTEFLPCVQCFVNDEFNNDNPEHNDKRVVEYYAGDCGDFGYFANETLAYPSTTRSSMPLSTQEPTLKEGSSDCPDLCNVVRAQIDECGLTPLDTDRPPGITYVPNPVTSYYGSVLLNRTAGECMCTLPVLRRFHGCHWCMVGDEGMNPARDVLFKYDFDCNALGYWTDSQVLEPEEEPTVIPAPPVPTPSQTTLPDGAESGNMAFGLVLCAGFAATGLLLLV